MAGTRISGLAALTTVADDDELVVIDKSDTTMAPTGTNKKVTTSDLAVAVLPIRDAGTVLVGDGSTDDGPALNTYLIANAGRVIMIPQGFIVRTTVPIDVPSGTTLRAYGATLKNACAGVNDRLLRMIGVSDVTIEGLELDGDKASFGSVTEQRHNVHMTNADNITLRDVYSHHAKGDGYYVGDNAVVADYSTNVTLDNCRAIANHRNGLSVVAVDGMSVFGGEFSQTSGTNPEAGIDVEPNAATGVCRNIMFIGVVCRGNVGAGSITQAHSSGGTTQRNVTWVGCTFTGSTNATLGRGAWVRNPRDVRYIGCTADDNAAEGFYIDSNGSVSLGVSFVDGSVCRNGLVGAEVLGVVPNVTIRNNDIKDNSQVTPNALDGLRISPTSTASGFNVEGNRFDGTSQRNGVRTGANAQGVYLALNRYGTMGTGPRSLADQQGSRVDLDYTSGMMLSNTSASSIAFRFRESADTVDRLVIRTDGIMLFSTGGATADVRLQRRAVGVLGMNAQEVFRHGSGTTAQRPAFATAGVGAEYFDTTLGIPIWSTGAAWVNSAGVGV